MKRLILYGVATSAVLGTAGCGRIGAGGWFLFLVLGGLLVVLLIKVFRESEATSDSLISIEGQLRRLNNRLEELTGTPGGDTPSKKPAKTKTGAKKRTASKT